VLARVGKDGLFWLWDTKTKTMHRWAVTQAA
jgi:hypothetical protein